MNNDKVFINNNFVDKNSANISVFDRGFLFADGIYEVIPVCGDIPYFINHHLERLQKNLGIIEIDYNVEYDYWANIINNLIKYNGKNRGIYIQITRGADIDNLRTHAPNKDLKPTAIAFSLPEKEFGHSLNNTGISAITHEDIRWQLCHVKSVSLLANALLSKRAYENSAAETLLIKNNYITEGTSSNIYIVKNNEIMTPVLNNEILPGITRKILLDIALKENYIVKYSKITIDDLYNADEVWISGQIKELQPVTKIDDKIISDGKPGPLWKKMSALYIETIKSNL